MLVERARRAARCRWARTSASATGPRRRRRCCAPRPRSRRASSQLVEVDGEIVSSTPHPRAGRGRRGRARPSASSARPFQMRGEVVHGDKRGRTLGFPTANLVPDQRARRARATASTPAAPRSTGAGQWRAAVNVGVRPTFVTGRGAAGRGVPARLRRRPLRPRAAARLPERLRGERRFDSVDALVEQMHRDVETGAAHRRLTAARQRGHRAGPHMARGRARSASAAPGCAGRAGRARRRARR